MSHEIPVPKFLNVVANNLGIVAGLKEQVRGSGGEVRIIVHPFFFPRQIHPNNFPGYIGALHEEVADAISTQTPLIFWEEAGRVQELGTRFDLGGCDSVYVVPTQPASPTPLLTNSWIGFIFDRAPWHKTIDALKSVGIRNARLSGRLLEFNDSGVESGSLKRLVHQASGLPAASQWLNSHGYPLNCVGETAVQLIKTGIDVSFSRATHPQTVNFRLKILQHPHP